MAATRTFHDRYQARVVASVRRMGLPTEDAEEVWDDAFTSTIMRLASRAIEPLGEGLRRYLFGAARRRAATVLTERGQEPPALFLEDLSVLRVPEPAPETSGPPSPQLVRLQDCLERAPSRHRIVAGLLLSSATADELAATLKIGKRSVYVIKARTLKWLKDCVEGAN